MNNTFLQFADEIISTANQKHVADVITAEAGKN